MIFAATSRLLLSSVTSMLQLSLSIRVSTMTCLGSPTFNVASIGYRTRESKLVKNKIKKENPSHFLEKKFKKRIIKNIHKFFENVPTILSKIKIRQKLPTLIARYNIHRNNFSQQYCGTTDCHCVEGRLYSPCCIDKNDFSFVYCLKQ